MKICHTCQQAKELTEFHKDRTAKDGLASSCKICRNSRKRVGFVEKNTAEGIIPFVPVRTKILVGCCLSLGDLIQELLLKHKSFLNFTINRKGNITLQIFASDLKRTYKGDTIDKLIELVVREEGL